MRQLLRKCLEVLDGSPAIYGRRSAGQSVVEMTLVTPLLIILIIGIIEIGWFANNYLILLETTRVGARRGAVLDGENSPLAWDNRASIHPDHLERDPRYAAGQVAMDPNDPNYDPFAYHGSEVDEVEELQEETRDCEIIGQTGVYIGFYNLVMCQMINSLAPLNIFGAPGEENENDIIISAFAIQMVHNVPPSGYATSADPSKVLDLSGVPRNPPYEPGWIPVVVGRYPTNANECNRWEEVGNPNDDRFFEAPNPSERDPFDLNMDGRFTQEALAWPANPPNNPEVTIAQQTVGGQLQTYVLGSSPIRYLHSYRPLELAREFRTAGEPPRWVAAGYDDDNRGESQRGFVYTGLRKVEEDPRDVNGREAIPDCIGSDWTVYEVEQLISAEDFLLTPGEIDEIRNNGHPNFACLTLPDGTLNCDYNAIDTRQFLQNQGMVLTEIYYEHKLLVDLPLISPFYDILGGDTTTIDVWSAFPLPTIVPELEFDLTWEDFFSS